MHNVNNFSCNQVYVNNMFRVIAQWCKASWAFFVKYPAHLTKTMSSFILWCYFRFWNEDRTDATVAITGKNNLTCGVNLSWIMKLSFFMLTKKHKTSQCASVMWCILIWYELPKGKNNQILVLHCNSFSEKIERLEACARNQCKYS